MSSLYLVHAHCNQLSHTYSNLHVEVFAENLYFKSQVELEIWGRVQFTEYGHDGHRPWIGRLEHTTLSARLKDFGNKWHNIKKLLEMEGEREGEGGRKRETREGERERGRRK